jgi:hypothetical protein
MVEISDDDFERKVAEELNELPDRITLYKKTCRSTAARAAA